MLKGYDETNKDSIKEYSQRLLDKSLRESIDPSVPEADLRNKGSFGTILEKYYFHYEPNSNKEPDFKDARVELKSSPLKKLTTGNIVSKERMVLNIINYEEMGEETWETSRFKLKNSLLMLIFYLWQEDKNILDYIIKLADLWEFPKEDLKIIKDDWEKICKKIREGKANELSDGDTLFLGACTKGATSEGRRSQPYSNGLAKQRALNIKQKYLNFIIHELAVRRFGPDYAKNWGYNAEKIVKDIKEYQKDETLEDLVHRKFQPYFEQSIPEMKDKFGLEFTKTAKQKANLITKAILGISKDNKIEEFEKADVEVKTITLEKSGVLRESMSFPHIVYNDIVRQTFEDSPIYEKLNKRFFFVIFQKDDNDETRLKKVMFWTMPKKDQDIYRRLFNDTKQKIKKGIYNDFVKISDERIGHIRPHGRDKKDLIDTPQGTKDIKRCFWLNASYIKKQIGPIDQ